MKRLVTLLLALVMVFSLVACGGSGEEAASSDYKIGIITGTVSQGEEEYQAAQNLKAKYGDKVVTATYPDNFSTETEQTIATVTNMAADPDVKAIVFVQAVPGAAAAINKAKAEGRRIIAVGTTAVRTLESAGTDGVMKAGGNFTQIFIYPGYEYRFVDALVTNFHLPQSTLLMLVSALSSREIMLNAYAIAVAEKYRFFSFGDAMFIKNK